MDSPREKSLKIRKEYLDLIREGKKTVEGRIGKPEYRDIQKGDRLKFYVEESPEDDVICEVEGVQSFSSFGEMLKAIGYLKCLPLHSSFDSALETYLSFPGYEKGVCAFQIKVLKSTKLLVRSSSLIFGLAYIDTNNDGAIRLGRRKNSVTTANTPEANYSVESNLRSINGTRAASREPASNVKSILKTTPSGSTTPRNGTLQSNGFGSSARSEPTVQPKMEVHSPSIRTRQSNVSVQSVRDQFSRSHIDRPQTSVKSEPRRSINPHANHNSGPRPSNMNETATDQYTQETEDIVNAILSTQSAYEQRRNNVSDEPIPPLTKKSRGNSSMREQDCTIRGRSTEKGFSKNTSDTGKSRRDPSADRIPTATKRGRTPLIDRANPHPARDKSSDRAIPRTVRDASINRQLPQKQTHAQQPGRAPSKNREIPSTSAKRTTPEPPNNCIPGTSRDIYKQPRSKYIAPVRLPLLQETRDKLAEQEDVLHAIVKRIETLNSKLNDHALISGLDPDIQGDIVSSKIEGKFN
ncbi:hypothetical protein DdX_14280 [Ditylenchus destructor]|uniref:ASCH domain-containing protein n=1 Tax=Ditylenchus destructor TaxID=166010 RepID=A0AAD4R225_9BILA|nr:hypothetical protein DdX_14280 [Ditylenchus destructor]